MKDSVEILYNLVCQTKRLIRLKGVCAFMTLLFCLNVSSQSNRITTFERIGWYNCFGTLAISKQLGLHAEYQFRRDNYVLDWQQSLLRVGVNYAVNPRVLMRIGYSWVETFAYGEIPINGFGRDFTEHRIFQMVQLSHDEGLLDFTHRFMLEQRFIGRYSNANVAKEDEFPMSNRVRYQCRIQIPLKGKEVKEKTPYLAMYDELFIGFGKNVNANVFDQNRVGLLLGYKFNQKVRLEIGWIHQIVQFGRQINAQNIFQFNSGLLANANFNFERVMTKKRQKNQL